MALNLAVFFKLLFLN